MVISLVRCIRGPLGLLVHDGSFVKRASAVEVPDIIIINPHMSRIKELGKDVGYCFTLSGAWSHFITTSGQDTFGEVFDEGVFVSLNKKNDKGVLKNFGNSYAFDINFFGSASDLADQVAIWVSNPALFSQKERNEIQKIFSDLIEVNNISESTETGRKLLELYKKYASEFDKDNVDGVKGE